MAEGRIASGLRGGLFLIGIGLAILAVVVIGPGRRRNKDAGPAGSSFASGDRGAKAAYLLLARLGHKVERRVRPLGDLGGARLAFVLSPSDRLDEVSREGIAKWLEAGGTLVFGADAFNPGDAIARQALDLAEVKVSAISATQATLAKDWHPARTLFVRALVSAGTSAADPGDDEEGDHSVIAHAKQGSVALRFARGEGAVYVLDARVFSDDGLKAADNAVFLASLAARHAGGEAILFDEYAHGFGNLPSLLGMTAWPLKVAFVVALIALFLYALSIGRRLGPPSPEPAPARRASIEQIEALAAFFAAGGDRQTALLALAAHAGKPVPTPPPRDDRAFLLAAQALLARPSATTTPVTRQGAEWPSTGSTPPPRK